MCFRRIPPEIPLGLDYRPHSASAPRHVRTHQLQRERLTRATVVSREPPIGRLSLHTSTTPQDPSARPRPGQRTKCLSSVMSEP